MSARHRAGRTSIELERETFPHVLGIGFLHQAGPKFLVVSAGMHKEEVLAYNRQAVIDDYLHPLATLPELEDKDMCEVLSSYVSACPSPGKPPSDTGAQGYALV